MADSSMADVFGGAGKDVGSLIGYFMSSGNRAQAQQDLEQALANYQNLDPKIYGETAGASAFNDASIDPKDRAAQLDALSHLQDIYKSNGLDAGTKAQLAETEQSEDANARAMDSSIQNEMAQRGLGNSAASYAQQQIADQQASNRAANEGMQALAQGENRKMQALSGAASIGSGLQSQDWQEAAQKAAAKDAMARFNANQLQQAQEETYGNSLGQAEGEQSALGGMAGNQLQQGQQLMGVAGGVGEAVGSTAGAGLDEYNNMSSSASGGGGGGGGAGGIMDLVSSFF